VVLGLVGSQAGEEWRALRAPVASTSTG